MHNKSKKTLLLTSLLAGVTTLAAGIATYSVTASADTVPTFEMTDGASLRVSDPTGLRFKVNFNENYYERITTTDAELHVAIIPYDYYTAYEASGESALYPWLKSTYGAGNFLDMEIPDAKIYEVSESGETYYAANAVMTNVRIGNYHRDFVGVAYIQTGNSYEEVSIAQTENVRSVMDVANAAMYSETDKANYEDFLTETLQKGMYGAYGVGYNTQTGYYTYNGANYTFDQLSSVIDLSQTKLNAQDVSLMAGETAQLNPTLKFGDGVSYTNDAYYTYSVANTNVATVDENGKITALTGGETTVTIKALGGLYETTKTIVVVERAKEIISEDVLFMAQGDGGIWNYKTGNATFELDGVPFDLTDVEKVLCNGEEVQFSVEGINVTFTNAPGGDQLYSFMTADTEYVIGGCIYGKGISTAEELDAWRNSEGYCYTVLLNDIDYEGATIELSNKAIYNTLDGRGYSISNFTYTTGFLQLNQHSSVGIIKNISFKNVTQDCSTLGSWPNVGLFGKDFYGTVENVYAQITTANIAESGQHCGTLVGNLKSGAVLKNVVVDVSNAANKAHYAINSVDASATVEGVVGATAGNMSEVAGSWNTTQGGFYTSISAMVEGEVSDELTTFTSPYWVIDTTAGTIAMQPKDKMILKKTVVNVTDKVLLAKGSGGQWSYNTGTANVDFSAYGADFSMVEKVLLDGEELANYTASDATLTLTNVAGGDHTVTIETPTHVYNATVCVYVYGISTAEEFDAWRNSEGYCYTVLLNDIDYEGATIELSNKAIYNTLDGRGYSISNFTYTTGFLQMNQHSSDGIIKNISFTNVTQDCSTLSSWPIVGLFGKDFYGTVENVYAQITTANIAESGQHCGTLVGNLKSGAVLKNVVVDVSNAANKAHYAIKSVDANATVEGVVGATAGNMSEVEGSWNTTKGGFYTSISAMVTGEADDELTTFTSPYWVIDTTAGTIAMQPFVCNYVQVSGSVNGSDGTANVVLGSNGITGAVTEVLVNGQQAVYEMNGNVLSLSGLEDGEYTVTVVTANGRNVYTLKVVIGEIPADEPEDTPEETPEKDLIKINGTYFNEKGSLDLTGSGINAGEIMAVSVNDSAVNYSVNGDVLTVPAQTNGEQYTYVVETVSVKYTFTVYACEVAISTAEEFVAWATTPTVTGATTISAYTVLANDITLDGNVISGISLYGTFDGRGYAIYNLTTIGTKGLFSNINSGKFRNVQLINYTQDCKNAAATQGLFGDWVGGTVENVLIQGQIINLGANTHNGVLFHYPTGGTYRNIVAYMESDGTGKQYALSSNGSGSPTVENIYFVSGTNFDMRLRSWDDPYGTVSNTVRYASEEAMLEAVDFSSWATPWMVNADGAPRMRELKLAQITLSSSIVEARLSNGKFSVDLARLGIKGVTKVTVNGASSDAYTLSGDNVVFDVAEGNYELSFYTAWAVYHASATFVDALPSVILNGDVVLGKVEGGSAGLDLSVFDEIDVSNIREVYCNNELVEFFVSGNVLNLVYAPYGDQTYTIRTSDKQYTFRACVYDNAISSVSDLEAWRNNGLSGYSILLQNINYQGATLSDGVSVAGVLDGRGYSVSNFTYVKGFAKLDSAQSAIKNVAFLNATQDCSTLPDWNSVGFVATGFAGTIENVHLQVTISGLRNDHLGVLAGSTTATAQFRNVVVEIVETAKNCYLTYDKNATMVGVVGSTPKSVSETSTWLATGNGFYTSISAMVEGEVSDELTTFTSPYWQISALDGTIALKSLNDTKTADVEDGYLVKDGASAYALVVDSTDTSEAYRTAVSEFQALFAEATGVTLKTVKAENALYGDNSKYISLGNTDVVKKAGLSYNVEGLGSQGYAIRKEGQSLFIFGESQGIQNGVYELLNKIVDFEQYSKELYLVTKSSTVELPTDLQVEYAPTIEFRVAFSGAQRNDDTSRQRMRTQNMEEVFMSSNTAHNMLSEVVPFDTYYSTNSTWFSNQTKSTDTKDTTQLCYTAGGIGTDNYKAMKAAAIENIKSIILSSPSKSVMPLHQMDVKDKWCTCSGCTAVINQYGANSATQILFANDIAQTLAPWLKEIGRDVRFSIFAYVDTEAAPTGLKLHENVAVMIAAIYDNYMLAPDATGNQLASLLGTWSALSTGGGVFVWAYGVYFNEYLMPYNTFDQIQNLIQTCEAHEVEYLWIQGDYNAEQNTAFTGLKAYLISKLMWDSSLDVNTLTENYFNAMFGPVASIMMTVYTEMKAELVEMDKNGKLGGGINDSPTAFRAWNATYLAEQLDRLVTATKQLDKSDANYQRYYDAVVRESISLRYIYIENTKISYGIGIWGGQEYETTAWGSFEEDIYRLGFTRINEHMTVDEYFA